MRHIAELPGSGTIDILAVEPALPLEAPKRLVVRHGVLGPVGIKQGAQLIVGQVGLALIPVPADDETGGTGYLGAELTDVREAAARRLAKILRRVLLTAILSDFGA